MKLTRTFLALNSLLFCVSGCNFFCDIGCNRSKPCPCDAKPVVEHDEMGDLMSDMDLDHAFHPNEKIALKYGKAAVKLCQSSDGSFEIFKCITKKYGERGIIVRYQFENYINITYLDEICLNDTAKILKLKNGDALLSLLQGVGKGFYVNKLFVLHVDDDGKLTAFEVKIDEIFEQVKEKTELNLSFEKRVVTATDTDNHKSASFFLNERIKSMMNSKDLDIGQWIPCYSTSQLSYGFQEVESPKVFMTVSLMNEKKGTEYTLGEVSFDFEYRIKCDELLFDLNNIEIARQF